MVDRCQFSEFGIRNWHLGIGFFLFFSLHSRARGSVVLRRHVVIVAEIEYGLDLEWLWECRDLVGLGSASGFHSCRHFCFGRDHKPLSV